MRIATGPRLLCNDASMPDRPNDRTVSELRRRDLIGGAVAAGSGIEAGSPPSAAETRPLLPIRNDTELEIALPDLSNWHRWGTDDQLGTLNFITPQTRLAAAGLIRACINRAGLIWAGLIWAGLCAGLCAGLLC